MYLKYIGIAGLKVWVIGSSIIKRDLFRPVEIQLGLTRLGLSLWWQGRSGMSLYNLRRQVEIMTKFEDTPAFIFIHIGGNDIGK